MEFKYKKSLGQNFIYDIGFLRKLVKCLNVQPHDVVVEIGSGVGTLTQVLAETGCQVYSLEIDQRLKPILTKRLESYKNVQLIFTDATIHDFTNLPNFRLIANVPYYITTPLIMQFLSLPNCYELNILVAEEVAERIVAPHGNALYGALSVTCQLQAECQILARVPRAMFTPQPKIDSAFVSLKKHRQLCDPFMERMLKGIFSARRKTMLNALSSALPLDKNALTQVLVAAEIDATLRPEQITPTQYAKLREILRKFC